MHCWNENFRGQRTLFAIAIVVLILSDSARGQAAPQATQEKSASQLAKDGMAAYGNKEYALASRLLQEAVAKGATDVDTVYNTACSLALAGETEKAFQFLTKAIQAGFRNTSHLRYDVDLNSLHNDPRWEKIVAACEAQRERWIKDHSEPNNAHFITADIDRFWKAYDQAMAAPAEERVAIFQRDYIDPGTVGLKDWAASGRVNAKKLVETIDARPNFFKAIRPITLRIQTQRESTLAAFRKFKELYPDAVFPEAYFVIGQLQSGGTSSDNGLLMGAEMFSRSTDTPVGELTDWQREAIMPDDDISPLVVHESVHFQQKYLAMGGLLCACLKEGSADFLGKLTSGRMIARMESTHEWANARERELWMEFQKQMDGKDTSRWLYGKSGGNGRPVDLGYWMGYKISEAYYKSASDKKQAVRDMLLIKNCKEFLNASRYAEKFVEQR
jgi:tetratricopeptide (TPR) repeat protein